MWDQRYSADDYAYGTDPNDFVRHVADRIPAGGRVLCIAEGEGRNAVYLAQQGFDVTMMDGSSEGVAKALRLAQDREVSIQAHHADLRDYAIEPGAWDGVVAVFAHLPPDLRAQVHGAVAAGLRPGGAFVLEAYTPDQLKHGTGGPPVAAMMMTLDTLRSELPGLEFEHSEHVERVIHEGKFHNGLSATVQLVARRPA